MGRFSAAFSLGWYKGFADVGRVFRTRRVIVGEIIDELAKEFPAYPREAIAKWVRKMLS